MWQTLEELDIALYRHLIRLQGIPAAARLARALSRTGDGYLYAAMGLVLVALGGTAGAVSAEAILVAFVIELPCFMALKAMIRRDRPFTRVLNSTSVIVPVGKFSMPSGHTAAAFLMATLLGYFFPDYLLAVYLWALLIGLSRVILGVHYPSDIVAGAILGSSCAMLSIVLVT